MCSSLGVEGGDFTWKRVEECGFSSWGLGPFRFSRFRAQFRNHRTVVI